MRPQPSSATRCYPRGDDRPHARRGACLSRARRASTDRPDAAPIADASAPSAGAFDDIPRATWDACAPRNPWATPFSRWAFHRAWWDAYGANAHEETLVVVAGGRAGRRDPIAIVPLMHRHEVEPADVELTHTKIRHGDGPRADAGPADARRRVFFGASYHADYATLLPRRPTCPPSPTALADYLRVRRRPGHPRRGTSSTCAGCAAATRPPTRSPRRSARARWPRAGRSTSSARTSARSSTLPEGADIDDYLATLGKKERHEIRRKVRRAEAVGEVALDDSTDPLADLERSSTSTRSAGASTACSRDTPGGDQSRVFVRRLFELFGAGRRRCGSRS